jgi:hypothetical protein
MPLAATQGGRLVTAGLLPVRSAGKWLSGVEALLTGCARFVAALNRRSDLESRTARLAEQPS